MTWELDLQPTAALDDDAWREMRELQAHVHGAPASGQAAEARVTWSGAADSVCVIRVRESGVLVSSLHVNQRSILADGQALHAGGLRAVQTHPDFRRRGYARTALERAAKFMFDELQVEAGVLFASRMAVPLYQGLGWQILRVPVWCEQPTGAINYTALMPDDPPMLLPPPGGRPPIDHIDLCGLPW